MHTIYIIYVIQFHRPGGGGYSTLDTLHCVAQSLRCPRKQASARGRARARGGGYATPRVAPRPGLHSLSLVQHRRFVYKFKPECLNRPLDPIFFPYKIQIEARKMDTLIRIAWPPVIASFGHLKTQLYPFPVYCMILDSVSVSKRCGSQAIWISSRLDFVRGKKQHPDGQFS